MYLCNPMAKTTKPQNLTWSNDTQLVGLVLELEATSTTSLYAQYTIALHAWFLNQVRQYDPDLSAYLHDGESEKPFNISALAGQFVPTGTQLQLQAHQTYQWHVNALTQPVAEFFQHWLTNLPTTVEVRNAPLQIKNVNIAHAPTTYSQLLQQYSSKNRDVKLSFISPTSFRRQGHHFPLPVPVNLFHSYLRRWNDFSGMSVEQDAFLEWIDKGVIINQFHLDSTKVAAGKRGSVTGFMGAMSLSLNQKALGNPEFTKLFYALVKLAPYCGTGHKTTFGLGQTRLDWVESVPETSQVLTSLLGERISELTELFKVQKKRQGGERAEKTASTWATILARREMGESLIDIATDLEIPYETVKTYAKLARNALKE